MQPSDQTIQEIHALQAHIHQWARNKGFWNFTVPVPSPNDERMKVHRLVPLDHYLVKSTKLMLIVSELSELLEGLRKPEQANEAEELADTVIRILDYAGAYNIDLMGTILQKMAINEQRPYKHGKQF